MEDEMMDKYAVETGSEDLEKKASDGCPICGATPTRHGTVLICPVHGSSPWETK